MSRLADIAAERERTRTRALGENYDVAGLDWPLAVINSRVPWLTQLPAELLLPWSPSARAWLREKGVEPVGPFDTVADERSPQSPDAVYRAAIRKWVKRLNYGMRAVI